MSCVCWSTPRGRDHMSQRTQNHGQGLKRDVGWGGKLDWGEVGSGDDEESLLFHGPRGHAKASSRHMGVAGFSSL